MSRFFGRNSEERHEEPVDDTTTLNVVKLLTLNTYLIPPMFVNDDNKTCQNQETRGRGIGELIARSQYDVVCLQEMWGAAMGEVEDPLSKAYEIMPYCSSWGAGFLDVAWQYMVRRGGLWMAFRKKGIPPETSVAPSVSASSVDQPRQCDVESVVATKWFTYSFSKTKSKKGIHAARLKLRQPSSKSAKYLIVVNTHTDPMNVDQAIEKQADELTAFITSLLADQKEFMKCCHSEECAMVIVGDFNVDANGRTNPELRKSIFSKLHVTPSPLLFPDIQASDFHSCSRDLYADFCGKLRSPPATYDSSNRLVMWQQSDRLDWVLAVTQWEGELLAKVHCDKCQVVKQAKGEELSDHWGVAVDLRM